MPEQDANNNHQERLIGGETTIPSTSDESIRVSIEKIRQQIEATGQVVDGDILPSKVIGTTAAPPDEQSTSPSGPKQLTPNSSRLGLMLRRGRLEKKAA